MARAKLSPILTGISGSIGGVTIQRNKFGNTIRQKPLPINPASTGQYNVRQKMIEIQKEWQDLTDAERLQWNRFVDFSLQSVKNNKSIKLSGHALFIKYQLTRLLSGRPILSSISYVPMPPLAGFDQFKANYPLMWIHFDQGIITSEYWFLLRMTSPRQPTRKFSPRGLRVITCTYTSSSSFNVQDDYIAAFGAAANIGDTVHYSLTFYNYVSPILSGVYTGTAVIASL